MPRLIPNPALPLHAWPDKDRFAWTQFLQGRGDRGRNGQWPFWKESTLRGVQASYGRWLAWLAETNAPELARAPGDRLRPIIVQDYFEELRPRLTNVSISTALIHIVAVTRIISAGYDGKWLRPIVARLRRNQPSTRGKLERIVPIQHLFRLGFDLMANARTFDQDRPHRGMLEYRDGLAVALLAARPLRLANFLALKTGESLRLRGKKLWICFEASETKNGRTLEFPFPPEIRQQYEQYLKVIRPYLALGNGKRGDRTEGRFWVSEVGRPLSRNALYTIIMKRTLLGLGKPVNPHLFRDCMATSIATERSDLIWTIPHMLGHWNSVTSEACYTHAAGVPEQNAFSDHVISLRQRASRSEA